MIVPRIHVDLIVAVGKLTTKLLVSVCLNLRETHRKCHVNCHKTLVTHHHAARILNAQFLIMDTPNVLASVVI